MKLVRFFLAMVLVVTFFGKTSADGVSQAWVARYGGPGPHPNDTPRAMTLDAAGNIYVTGSSFSQTAFSDIATIKYDPDGNQTWAARYRGVGIDPNAEPVAIAVDASENVYVTGSVRSRYFNSDYVTIKYDSGGNQLWAVRFNGGGNSFDSASALAVDLTGNVIVTGSTPGPFADSDFATLKYDANGAQQWVIRYNYHNFYEEIPGALAIDLTGHIYITGFSNYGIVGPCVTLKYNPDGTGDWAAFLTGPHNLGTYGKSIALDSNLNVIVSGWTLGLSDNYDGFIVKYDNDGNEMWTDTYVGPDNLDDIPRAMAVDSAGDIYITGYSSGIDPTTGRNAFTIKYGAGGSEEWMAVYRSPEALDDYAMSIAIDPHGGVVVAGASGVEQNLHNYLLIRYSADGTQEWVERFSGAAGYNDWAVAVAVDRASNIYVTGEATFQNGTETDTNFATVKYSQTFSSTTTTLPSSTTSVPTTTSTTQFTTTTTTVMTTTTAIGPDDDSADDDSADDSTSDDTTDDDSIDDDSAPDDEGDYAGVLHHGGGHASSSIGGCGC